ncbi:MAG: proline--tRNA ligase, partial [Actinomycetota bacterium]|nr:proline--tRNA ligase [Actinomycetota bacterium]
SLDGVVAGLPRLLDEMQSALLDDALQRREAATFDVGSAAEVDGAGLFRVPWDALGVEGEARLAERGYTVRCLVTAEGQVPDPDDVGLIAYVARAY